MNVVVIIKVKILTINSWSYKSIQFCWILNLEWLPYFEHIIQSLFEHVFFFWYMFMEAHLTTVPS